MDSREGGLLRWQWSLYPGAHRHRGNLLVHALSAPLYLAGTCALVVSLFAGVSFTVAGIGLMLAAMAAQAKAHKLETNAPAPFRGPGDLVARLFVEQWVTFPRYVLTGGFGAAWRGAK